MIFFFFIVLVTYSNLYFTTAELSWRFNQLSKNPTKLDLLFLNFLNVLLK